MNTKAYLTILLPALLWYLTLIEMPGPAVAAEAPLKVHLYSSLVVGVSDKHALAFTQPLIDLLQEQVQYPLEFGLAKGSGVPNKDKVGTVTKAQIRKISETKFNDLNAFDLDQADRIIEGTARSMGIDVVD